MMPAEEEDHSMTNLVAATLASLVVLALISPPAFAQGRVAGAQVYELTENAKFTFGRSRLPFREAGVSQMLGFAALGTPLCPTPDLATPVSGTPALPGNPSAACVLNVTGSDHINLTTGLGTISGQFTIVKADLLPAVDTPETVVARGNFSGQIDFSAALQGLPFGTVTGHFTSNLGGGAIPFVGVFLLPFADPRNQTGFGYLLYQLVPDSDCPQGVCFTSPAVQSQPVQPNQQAIGYPTPRFDIYFQ